MSLPPAPFAAANGPPASAVGPRAQFPWTDLASSDNLQHTVNRPETLEIGWHHLPLLGVGIRHTRNANSNQAE